MRYNISQQTELINMINAENLSCSNQEQAVNKINYVHIKNVYLICDTNLTLTKYMIKAGKMFQAFILQSNSFFHIEQKT